MKIIFKEVFAQLPVSCYAFVSLSAILLLDATP